jgi:hypothetical protein
MPASSLSSPPVPVEFRDTGISPAYVSSFEGSRQGREEFERGAQLLGYEGRLHPQQYVIADALNATQEGGLPLNTFTGVCVPRRASKTTSIFLVLLGRCLSRQNYVAGYSAQNGLKTRERFLRDIVGPLEALYPDEATRPFKFDRSKGSEYVRILATGSVLHFRPPKPESMRGDAYDVYVLDEAQEHDAEASEELLGALLPTFDTRPDGQLVVAGTAGTWRGGMLWSTLEDGRAGKAETGIVEYAADQDLTVEDFLTDGVKDWDKALPLIRVAHPGIDTLTNIKIMERNFEKLDIAQFLREYLGVWPKGAQDSVLNIEKWHAGLIEDSLPAAPGPDAAMGIAVHQNQLSACIAYAWRDAEGAPVFVVADHRLNVSWLVARVLYFHRSTKAPVVYDSLASGPVMVQVDALTRAKPKPKLLPVKWADVQKAHQGFLSTLNEDVVHHYGQEPLTHAVSIATKRSSGSRGQWAFGRPTPDADITPLEACLLALAAYDARPIKTKPVFSM